MTDLARPYVPTLVQDWLREDPPSPHRRMPGTLVFADVSGFTALTERLATRGKIGAEEMGNLLNVIFERLLTDAYDYGAALLKWGGDAALLLYDGDEHAARACRAAWEMQRTIRRMGTLRTSVGTVNLRMSVGIHSGDLDFYLVGSDHHELIVTGPAATKTAAMETAAEATEIVVSDETARLLESGNACTARRDGPGRLLTRAPDVAMQPRRDTPDTAVDPSRALPRGVAEHVASGRVESEHRQVVSAFIHFGGTDAITDPVDLGTRLGAVIDAATSAAERHGVTFLATDIAGDGGKVILAAGVPQTRGDSEQRVLGAVRDILDSGVPLPVRAGVNRGRVFAGDFGPPYRRTFSIVGDSVNLAARLMGKAEPGQLITTPEVLSHSNAPFPVEPLEPFMVKGKSAPIEAVMVTGPALVDAHTTAANTLPFVGRDSELARLLTALEACRSGEGRIIEIVGDRGMGKSRLVDEFRAATARPLYWSVCDVYGATTPYAPLRRQLRALLGVEADANPADAATVLRATVAKACPDLTAWLPLLARVVGADVEPTREVDNLDEQFRLKRLAATVVSLLEALVREPTAFVVEDMHFGDAASVDLLRALGRAASDNPWLFVVTRRPDERGVGATEEDTITLTPLDAETASNLLDVASEATPITRRELDLLREKAGGNPLFLQELVAARIQYGTADAVPDSIEDVVAAQIDQLDPSSRALLRAAAVLGLRSDRRVLDEVLGQTTADWQAVERYLAIDRTHVSFRHALAREVAYEALPYGRRRVLHELAAGAIERIVGAGDEEAGVLSLHYAEGGRPAAALPYAARAAELAELGSALVEAAVFSARALDCALKVKDDDRATYARRAAKAWLAVRDMDRLEAACRLFRRHARTADELVTAEISIADVCMRTGRPALALRWLGKAWARDSDERALVASKYATVRWQQGKLVLAEQWCRQAIALADATHHVAARISAYQMYDYIALSRGDFLGEPYAARALETAVEIGDLRSQAYMHNQLGMRYYYRGEWDDAIFSYEEGRTILEKLGDENAAVENAFNVSEIIMDQGHLDDAERRTADVLRAYRAAKDAQHSAWPLSQLGIIQARRGRVDAGLQSLAAARGQFANDGDHASVVLTDARRAEALLLGARPADAREVITTAMTDEAATLHLPLLRRLLGCAYAQEGNHARANEEFATALRLARERGAKQDIAWTLGAMGVDDEEHDKLVQQLGIVWMPDLISPPAQG